MNNAIKIISSELMIDDYVPTRGYVKGSLAYPDSVLVCFSNAGHYTIHNYPNDKALLVHRA